MQELDFKVQQTAGKIDCNFAELRSALAVQMSAYADAVVDEDSITSYKGELATLRKIRKAVDDKRKEIERDFCKPVDDFKEQVKLLLEEIDKPINLIDSQIKMFTEEKAQKKLEVCKQIYSEMIGEYESYLPFDSVFDKKWLNVSYKNSDVQYDISEKIAQIKSDLAVIDGLASEIKDEVIKVYKSSGNNLAKAVARNSQYLADKNKIEAQKLEQSKAETKEVKVESKEVAPVAQLNDLVNKLKTVKFIISAEDSQRVQNMLDFSEIKYQIVEGD